MTARSHTRLRQARKRRLRELERRLALRDGRPWPPEPREQQPKPNRDDGGGPR